MPNRKNDNKMIISPGGHLNPEYMGPNKEIVLMVSNIRKRFPFAVVSVDAPKNPKGQHFIDVRTKKSHIPIAWRPDKGFGFFSKKSVYGEGPDQIFTDPEKVLEELREMLG